MRFLATLPLLLPVTLAHPVYPAADPAVSPASRPVESSPRADLVGALEILHQWDRRRERAWAAGDVVTVRSLYVPGSRAGRADVRLLRSYAARGIVVRRIVTQVFAVRVLRGEDSLMRFRVFDRVAGGVVLQSGQEMPLASSRPVTRDVELRPGPVGWRVASVTRSINGWGSGPRAARR